MPPSVTELSAATSLAASEVTLLHACLALVADDLEAAEHELTALLQSSITVIPTVGGHLAFAGGKRLRPLLALLSARAAGYDDPRRITIAAVGELLHTATLLHDDVTDAGEFRRGRPAARMVHGNGLAVLTGDYCLARALQAVARTGELAAVLSMADMVTRMAEGEVAQLHAAGDATLDVDRYHAVIERKTAALIAWCTAVAGLPRPELAEPLHAFGLALGFAFQIVDDLIDYRTGGIGAAGKAPGQDLREGKMTLPLILACERDRELHALVVDALADGPPLAETTAHRILRAVVESDALERGRAIAIEHTTRALVALSVLPRSPARDALASVAEYGVRRRR